MNDVLSIYTKTGDGRFSRSALRSLVTLTKEQGGFSFALDPTVKARYAVGGYGTIKIPREDLKPAHIRAAYELARNAVDHKGDPVHGFGTWVDDGIVYIDLVRFFDKKVPAQIAADINDERAIYDTLEDQTLTRVVRADYKAT